MPRSPRSAPGSAAAEVAALQERVYSRAGEGEPLVPGVDPLTGRTVLATAAAHRLRALTTPANGAGSIEAATPAPGSPPTQRRHRARVSPSTGPGMFGLGLALLVGLLLGVRGTVGLRGLGSQSPVTDTSADLAAAGAVGAAEAAAALRVFGTTPHWPGDQPPHLGLEYDPDSIRSVLGPPPGAGYGVYVARRGSAEYCLIVQDADGTGNSSCATLNTIVRSGLHIRALVWSPRSEGVEPRIVQVFANWLATGEVLAGASPRAEDLTPPSSSTAPVSIPPVSPVAPAG